MGSALAFAAPWALIALAGLPVLYWLLRLTPPSPRRVRFPAIRLLLGLPATEQTPARTPWWLLLLRLLLAALLILAVSGPVLDPGATLPGRGPVVIVFDDGWAAATDWPARQAAAIDLIDRADQAGRPIILVRTSPAPNGDQPQAVGPLSPADARARIDGAQPNPWPTNRAAAAAALATQDLTGDTVAAWLSDGIATAGDDALAEALDQFAIVRVLLPEAPVHLVGVESRNVDLSATVSRAGPLEPGTLQAIAQGRDGRVLADAPVTFEADATTTQVSFPLPVSARNAVARIALSGEATAGAVYLIDSRWQRHAVGLVDAGADSAQPLLDGAYYIGRALEPFADIERAELAMLLESQVDMIALTDDVVLSDQDRTMLTAWVEAGGTLVRFAGPQLADGSDPMVPVPLRSGDRLLDGAMSWTDPMPLAPFPDTGPFHGLALPDDVTISRQVLAEPQPDLAAHTWARLTDGTPLVTADIRGNGRIILIHVTAQPDWSTLPLSGVFVDMLRRIADLGAGTGDLAGASVPLVPVMSLDGFGRLGDPPAAAVPIAPQSEILIGPRTPPGLYGRPDQTTGDLAVNLADGATLAPLQSFPRRAQIDGYTVARAITLARYLLAAALALMTVEMLAALALRGGFARRSVAAMLLTAAVGGLAVPAAPARAQDTVASDLAALERANNTYLAYVITGDAGVDRISDAGLSRLAEVLRQRTAAEPAGAVGIDPEVDDLAFFPFLYWPMTTAQVPLSGTAVARLNAYLRDGGTILFDTRDHDVAGAAGLTGPGPGTNMLRRLTVDLDVPPLVTVPPEHVLTRAFYLLQDFPGRFLGGALWVEQADQNVNDGVASIIVGSNDWAAAWATDAAGRGLVPLVPGGPLQREMAYRFGVNLTMYTLTGNYKADQVHVEAILDRLSQ